jgi:hypothetical protein
MHKFFPMKTKRGGLDMESLLELVRGRRSIRKSKPQDVPIQEIEELLEAASMHANQEFLPK